MADKTTMTVFSETLERFNWYKENFGFSDADGLLKALMDKAGVATLATIRAHEEDRKKRIQDKFGTEQEAVPVEG